MEKLFFIVDDDIVQNEIHSILLKKVDPDARVLSFNSTKSAFESIDNGQAPDVIFLDLHIPGEGNDSFLEEHNLRNCSGDIYLMSSVAYLNQPELLAKYPAIKDFISKPLLDYKLRSVIRHYA